MPLGVEMFFDGIHDFNPTKVINYNIPQSGFVKLTIYNAVGQKMAERVQGKNLLITVAFDLMPEIYQAGSIFIRCRKICLSLLKQ